MVQLTDGARQTSVSLKEFNKATEHLREAVGGLKRGGLALHGHGLERAGARLRGRRRSATPCAAPSSSSVVPRVPLREVPHAPDYIPGQFTYRGAVTPVVDLVRLMTGGACADRLSSRILIAAYPVGG